jgi:hypothetical protein
MEFFINKFSIFTKKFKDILNSLNISCYDKQFDYIDEHLEMREKELVELNELRVQTLQNIIN